MICDHEIDLAALPMPYIDLDRIDLSDEDRRIATRILDSDGRLLEHCPDLKLANEATAFVWFAVASSLSPRPLRGFVDPEALCWPFDKDPELTSSIYSLVKRIKESVPSEQHYGLERMRRSPVAQLVARELQRLFLEGG